MKISIIIPTFNYDKYIARAIRSCLGQSFPKNDFEIIVIDDSSKDSTKYILESYGDWINIMKNSENRGLSYSRNKGIMNARGEFVVNLDADDYLHQDFLRICDSYLNFNGYDAVACDYFLVDDSEKIIKRMSVNERPIACGIMFRRQHMIDLGLYDNSLEIGEDVDFRICFEKQYKIEVINLPLYRYRMHKNNLTRNEIKNRHFMALVARKHGCKINHTYNPSEFQKVKNNELRYQASS